MPPIVPAPRRMPSSSASGVRAGRNGAGPSGGGNGGGGGGAADGGGRKMGRKMDASHLLNFSLPARQEVQAPPRRSRRTGGGEGARWTLYNKEKFVNASFSFMLNPKGDYTAYFVDSDIFFNWPDILQILVPSAGAGSSDAHSPALPSCPICLSEPVAPRMTKCGHIYCYSCVLQYLALAESKSARCPICNDSIHVKDLKSVRALPPVTPLPLGAAASSANRSFASPSTSPTSTTHMPSGPASRLPRQQLRLIQRPHSTTLALPQSATWPSAAIPPHEAPFHFLPDVTSFARFMLASPEYIFGELDRDQADLEREKVMQRHAGESDLGLAFIEGAQSRILELKERFAMELGGPDGLVARKVLGVKDIAAKAEERAAVKASRERDRLERLAQSQARIEASTSTLPHGAAFAPVFVPGGSASIPFVPDPLFPGGSPPGQGVSSYPLALSEQQGHSLSTPSIPTLAHLDSPQPSTSPKTSFLSTSPPKPVLPVKPRSPPSTLAGLSSEPSFYFYQSADGRHVYLHPLDIRVLLAEFKTYHAFPETLAVDVEGTEEGTMNEDLRKRCKYLAHLPTGCAILFIQVDLTAHVSRETLAAFETPLRQRRQRRKEKSKREERDRRRAEDRSREEEELQLQNLTSDNFPSTWGHTPSFSGGGGDDFEDALARSLWDTDPDGRGEDDAGRPLHRPSTAPPQVTAATSIWSSRSFAPPIAHGTGRSAEDEAEVAALWRQFEAQQLLDVDGGRGGSRVVEGPSSTGSGGAGGAGSAAAGKKKRKGQKLVLTGGGRGAG